MTTLTYSQHAEKRMRQRGVRKRDIDLILASATLIGPNTYFLSQIDADREIRRRKEEIHAFERNCNRKLVVAGATVVTCYPSRKNDQKSTLRKERERT